MDYIWVCFRCWGSRGRDYPDLSPNTGGYELDSRRLISAGLTICANLHLYSLMRYNGSCVPVWSLAYRGVSNRSAYDANPHHERLHQFDDIMMSHSFISGNDYNPPSVPSEMQETHDSQLLSGDKPRAGRTASKTEQIARQGTAARTEDQRRRGS